MKGLLWCGLWGLTVVLSVGASGFSEDPAEKLTKVYSLGLMRTLEIRGQVEFELQPGPKPLVTVETTRALFDQLNVSNWWGSATVAIESGLRGPRERGVVKVTVVLPSLNELSVGDKSSGRGVWPGPSGTVRVGEQSTLNLVLEGTNFAVEASWLTQVTLAGSVQRLRLTARHQSTIDTTNLTAGQADVFLDEGSKLDAGPSGHGSGTVRHESQVVTEEEGVWDSLLLKEDSVIKTRNRRQRRGRRGDQETS